MEDVEAKVQPNARRITQYIAALVGNYNNLKITHEFIRQVILFHSKPWEVRSLLVLFSAGVRLLNIV